ncbi:MAG: hypothetical protein ACE5SW_06020 [Nitrososphaeraceae archaeon]
MQQKRDSEKTETITFRLKSYIIKDLKNESKMESITLNSLIQKILLNHLQWERYERKAGLLPMTKPFLIEMLKRIDEKDIIEIAHTIEKEHFRGIMTFIHDVQSIENFIDVLRSWLTVSWMQHTIEVKGDGTFSFRIQHDLGIKWSLYIQGIISELFVDIFKKNIKIVTNETTLSIDIPPK